METHIKQFDSTAIVVVEINNEGKAPETKYITIGTIGKTTEEELGKDALSYLKEEKGKKEVKKIFYADSEKYRKYLENAIKEYGNP